MYKIAEKAQLNENTYRMSVTAPLVSLNAKPGQFVILMTDDDSERIPLTISDFDRQEGTVTVIFQAIGASTIKLSKKEAGEYISHFTGPLGNPTDLEGIGSACIIGGGVGCAIALPIAKRLSNAGADVDIVAGFRSENIVILENEMREYCNNMTICTDDGSYGAKGFVTDVLKSNLISGKRYDCVIAIGPIPMMKAVCDITKSKNIRTVVSLNPIMIDGTGMCGCCRVTVEGKTKFACVDGPDFDGLKVDFDELIQRNLTYRQQETEAKDHICRLYGGAGND